jgi:hypothetical protein
MIATTLANNIRMVSENDTTFDWIVRIIDTCNNDFHFESVDNLIELYYKKTKNEDKYIDLQLIRITKYKLVHGQLF